jgi:hypothetical protein
LSLGSGNHHHHHYYYCYYYYYCYFLFFLHYNPTWVFGLLPQVIPAFSVFNELDPVTGKTAEKEALTCLKIQMSLKSTAVSWFMCDKHLTK